MMINIMHQMFLADFLFFPVRMRTEHRAKVTWLCRQGVTLLFIS